MGWRRQFFVLVYLFAEHKYKLGSSLWPLASCTPNNVYMGTVAGALIEAGN